MAVRVKTNPKAIEHLLKVASLPELRRRGKMIVDAANAATGGQGDFELQMYVGRNRGRATARTKTFRGRHYEAKQRTLSKSLDAGRG